MKWTPEHDAVLIQGLEEGKTYTEIGAQIGRSRKSVGGRVHTMGLPKRKPLAQAPGKPLGAPDALEPLTPYIEPERPQDGCQWIYGDPKLPGWHKCGQSIVRGPSPYCASHMVEGWYMPDPQNKPRPAPRPELRSDYR